MTTECSVLYRPDSPELRFLPEGPYSLPDGRLSWVGIQHGGTSTVGSVNIYDPSTKTNESFDLPGRPGFAFPTDQPGVFVCGVERSLGFFDSNTGDWTEFATDVDNDVDNTIINDGVVYEDNLIFGCKELEFKTKKAGLYLWRGKDKQLIQLRNDQICSNGKAVVTQSDNSLALIDIDSPSKTITCGELNIADGNLGEQRIIVDLRNEDRFPDGMIVTPDGRSVIVAFYDPGDPSAGAAVQYGIESGEQEAEWSCPGSPRVTCPQLFRLNDSVHLVLTSAVEHMEPDQAAKHTNAGTLFIGPTPFDSTGEQPTFPTKM